MENMGYETQKSQCEQISSSWQFQGRNLQVIFKE